MNRQEWISHLRWQVRAGTDRLDHFGILILVLALLVAGLGLTVLLPLQKQLSRLEADITGLARSAPLHIQHPRPSSVASKDPVASFLGFLPSSARQVQLLQQLHDLASTGNITTGKVRYSLLSLTHLPVDGLLIHLEWSGDDTALSTTLHRLLQHFPSLAIRQLAYGRSPDTGMANLTLELTLYMRRETSDAP